MTILRKKFDEVREICNRKEQEIANMRVLFNQGYAAE